MGVVQVHCPVPVQGVRSGARHPRPAQHDVPPAEHVCPAPTHEAAAQVPVVEPAWMAQVVPEQQSAVAVHAPPSGWHTRGGSHRPIAQMPEQHCAEKLHAPLKATQTPASATPASDTGVRQAPLWHVVPAQHVASMVQAPPSGVHVGDWQASRPVGPGRQSAPSQHWSLNWHVWPEVMQQGARPV